MTIYRTSSRRAVRTGPLIGRGGEGIVLEVEGDRDVVAKIYSDGKQAARSAKIAAMVAGQLYKRAPLVAFPIESLHGEQGEFAGFTMRKVGGSRQIHDLYGPASRRIHFPAADFRFLARTATNVARAVAGVHGSGCVIGDINHSGFLVSQKGTVALIDADSFQIRAGSTVHRCRVGVGEYTPPELQGLALETIDREPHHDGFGLAVIIFQLLFLARHPYAGRFGGREVPLEQAIREGLFAFSVERQAETRAEPPRLALTLRDLTPPVASAFERAFTAKKERFANRPTAAEWVDVLRRLESSLVKCRADPSHYYPSVGAPCPWCRIEAGTGAALFPGAKTAAGVARAARPAAARSRGWAGWAALALAVAGATTVATLPHWQDWIAALDNPAQQATVSPPASPAPTIAEAPPPRVATPVPSPKPAIPVAPPKSTTPAPPAAPGTPVLTSVPDMPPDAATSPPAPSGADVARLQRALGDLGFDVGSADGVLGAKTRRGLAQFAAAQQLDPNDLDAVIARAVTVRATRPSPLQRRIEARGIRLSPYNLSFFSMGEAVPLQTELLAALNGGGTADVPELGARIDVAPVRTRGGDVCKLARVTPTYGGRPSSQIIFCLGDDNIWTDVRSD